MKRLLFAILAASVLLTGCDKNRIESDNSGPGRISVKITDDPFNIDFVTSAKVTITKIEARKTGDDTGNPFVVLSEAETTVELIDLRNGVTQELVDIEVPNGDYDLVRLYIGEASLYVKDHEAPFKLKVPSGEQTGIKLFIDPVLHVEGGLTTELLLDFDLANSFVMRGNMEHAAGVNGFIFKPVIRAVNKSTAGRIEGKIEDDAADPAIVADATVWVTQQDETVATTFSDADGNYALEGLLAGTYSLFAEKEGYEPVSAGEVTVVAANKTVKDLTLISLPHYVSSVIENTAADNLVITFSKELMTTDTPADAFVVMVGETKRDVTSVAVNGLTVTLILASPVVKDDVVTVAYDKPATNPLQNEAGYEVPAFAAQDVTNNVGN